MSHPESAHEHHADDGLVHVHVHPESTYWKIFGALVVLTIVTVGLSHIHLGDWNFFIAVVFATVKAALVASFFMHLKDDNRFNVLLFVGALIFMGVFFVYTMDDTQHRGLATSDVEVLYERGPAADSHLEAHDLVRHRTRW